MATIATAQFASDDEDGDFAPALKDLHGADGEATSGSDSGGSADGGKRKRKKRKLHEESKALPEPEITKEAIDSLWASFNHGDASPKSAEAPKPAPKMVAIQKTFKFAGDLVTQEVQVAEDSEEAIAYLAGTKDLPKPEPSDPPAELAPVASSSNLLPPKRPPPTRKKGGLEAMQAKLASKAKPKKLTTLEKSKYDWDSHVKAEGLKDDLDSARKSQMSYLEKQDFLARAENAKEQAYQKLKSAAARRSNHGPEIEATMARLGNNKQVQGILILHRPSGSLLRSSGPLFSGSSVNEAGLTTAQAYAEKCWQLVESMANILGDTKADSEDVKFARLRVQKLEWIITPGARLVHRTAAMLHGLRDPRYVLLVVQDPASP